VNEDGRRDPVLGVLPDRLEAFQWHYYTFELPAGAVQLASSAAARQAYRLGERAWGIQFHAEVDRTMLAHWFVEGAAELPKPVVEVEADTAHNLETWNVQGRALCNAFLDEAAASGVGPLSAGRSGSRDQACQEPT
jgi:GMP synthase (glutamine-hydrolysing)